MLSFYKIRKNIIHTYIWTLNKQKSKLVNGFHWVWRLRSSNIIKPNTSTSTQIPFWYTTKKYYLVKSNRVLKMRLSLYLSTVEKHCLKYFIRLIYLVGTLVFCFYQFLTVSNTSICNYFLSFHIHTLSQRLYKNISLPLIFSLGTSIEGRKHPSLQR